MKSIGKMAFYSLWVMILGLAAMPLVIPLDPFTQELSESLQGPSIRHLLGTDELGRDYLARMIMGSTFSLSVAFLAVGGGVVVGGFLGLVAGFFGGVVDALIMRAMDLLLVFPGFLLALATAAVLGPGYWNLVFAAGVFSVPIFARVVRSVAVSVKEREFVEAAVASGAGSSGILFRHLLPNCIRPVMVVATNRLGSVILISGGLSFLGLGVQPPTPEWGAMLAAGRQYLWAAPHLVIFPGLAIFASAFAFNLLGELGESILMDS